MNSNSLINYYNENRNQFPVIFTRNVEWDTIEMHSIDTYQCLAAIYNDILRVYINKNNDFVWVSLADKCEQYQFDYDLSKPNDVLCAMIDVTYNVYSECVDNIYKRMRCIINDNEQS